ncbi:hypothetical protein LGL55_15610 [Clostridium tagluense]|uniref:hypothetical protein n=1 Tax=Clostridium tagluense TaxID=360422 RepID=UPI001C6EAB12|nr:hypothetical protein [Clostridium tagluense]MBW9158692.1 hypothetical protein [Clostridium tagluense]MCB2312704.1 hypothetical protein [Clostridium tagluense]MCB2317470.1 hypothetical protein [Clostridium tagluense]MCB2322299.1 hypothetical protein [Clostridium tagluense]MCB2327303.1 hypothetical protein [Clostridium tagluense]
MKFKPITLILEILLFIVSVAGCIMLFMQLELPTAMLTITTLLLIIVSTFEFIKTRKLRKLVYPLIITYFLVGMPIVEKVTDNGGFFMGFAVLGCVITIIFTYKDLAITNKEKELPH